MRPLEVDRTGPQNCEEGHKRTDTEAKLAHGQMARIRIAMSGVGTAVTKRHGIDLQIGL
jgi:hypothetical protein